MISPAEIKKKAMRWWNDGSFLRATINEEPFFPREIPQIGLVLNKEKATAFLKISEEQQLLHEVSKDVRGRGYSLEWEERNHQRIGKNRFIRRIYFETEYDFLAFTGNTEKFADFKRDVAFILSRLPQLRDWVLKVPTTILEYRSNWVDIVEVCEYFLNAHEPHRYYIRELPVSPHTKFIEAHKFVFTSLLDFLLPAEKIFSEHVGLRNFEKRYGLKYSEPQVRIRILDRSLAETNFSGLSDLSISESDFAGLRLPLKNVIIMENKTNYSNILNFLSMPRLRESIAVFGSGFRVWLLKRAEWLKNVNIYYWGDIDVQGLQILSQLRGYHPHVHALLMDFATLNAFKPYWDAGTETSDSVPENLNDEEKRLFEFLKEGNVRLEQEKLRHDYVVSEFGRRMERDGGD
jgi:hypothetical protein